MEPLRLGKHGRHGAAPVRLGDVSIGMPAISAVSGPAAEIAHILFLDIVGYSRLRTTQQADVQRELQTLINSVGEVTQGRLHPGKLIIRPTGDGAALLFLRDMLSPLRCAIQLLTLIRQNEAQIRSRTGTAIYLRVGIHSGPVIITEDINTLPDVAGEGINMAQRIMDCGDAGHILLSSEYAEKLRAIDPWSRYLQDIGEFQVKHGIIVHLYNFYGKMDGIPVGRPGKPERLRAAEKANVPTEKDHQTALRRITVRKVLIGTSLVIIAAGGGYNLWTSNPGIRTFLSRTFDQVVRPQQIAAATQKPKKEAKHVASERKKSRPNPAARPAHPVEASIGPNLDTVTASNPSGADKVVVPKFLGMTFDDAQNLAEEHGLKLQLSQLSSGKSDYSLDYEEGQICSQSVPTGTALKSGKTIYVRISKGEPPETTTPAADTTTAGN